eukprot:13894082-Alexandrium_andersonii.AAC.1
MRLIEAIPGAVNGAAPARRSPRWAAAARAIAAAASLAVAPRSWQQVYRAVHLRAAPAVATWLQVPGDSSVTEFRARWLKEKLDAAEVARWNLRWLVDQGTQQAASKRAVH